MSSVSGSSTVNGLYSNPNQVMGLVSGLDTQGMIQGLVDSYSQKIIGYQQDIVMMQWQQEAYRDVITDLVNFTSKYTSFANPETNIFSSAFFDKALSTVAGGANSDKVSVSGSSNSSVQIDSVLQVATASRYESDALIGNSSETGITGDSVDLDKNVMTGVMNGSMVLNYGGSSTVSINFNGDDIIEGLTGDEQGQAMADAINKKLASQNLTINGTTYTASDRIKAVYDSGSKELTFVDAGNSGNSVSISSKTGSSFDVALGIDPTSSEPTESISFAERKDLIKVETVAETIAREDITIDLNGTVRTISVPNILTTKDDSGNLTSYSINGNKVTFDEAKAEAMAADKEAWVAAGNLEENYDETTFEFTQNDFKDFMNDDLTEAINDELELAFKGTLSVSNIGEDGKLALDFEINNSGSNTLKITSSVGEYLGLGDTATNYLNTADSLGSILGEDYEFPDSVAPGSTIPSGASFLSSNGSITRSNNGQYWYDADGDTVAKTGLYDSDGEEIWAKVDDDGNFRMGHEIIINEVSVGVFDSESSLNDVLSAINTSGAGVTASFSSLTNKIVFTNSETGSFGDITIEGDLGLELFGDPLAEENKDNYTKGQDAVILATVNNQQVTLVRNSNSFDIDGLNITVKEAFNNESDGKAVEIFDDDGNVIVDHSKVDIEDPVTFTQESDVDPLVDAISEMVDDYNAMMDKIKTYFTETPLNNTSGGSYKPLTDEDSASMTDSAVASYEEKAKTGILFGDSNMRALYNSLSGVFSAGGTFGADLTAMGFDVGYSMSSSGTTVTLDKDKLKDMLENDLERVKSAFISSTDNGYGVDGVMQTLENKMNQYGAITGATKGILVQASGTELSSLSLLSNTMQDKIDNFSDLIATWEDKLSDKVTFYTAQFTQLEVLMSQMNSQSSALAGLGGY